MVLRVIPVILLVIALSGCTLPNLDMDVPSSSILARFDESSQKFIVNSDEPLPEPVTVTITGSGIEERIPAGAITGVGTTQLSFNSPVAFETGSQYSVTVLANGKTSGARTFQYLEDGPPLPPTGVRATYSFSFFESDSEMVLELTGEGTTETIGSEERLDLTGSGSMVMDDESMEIRINISQFSMAELGDRTISAIMHGSGTWSMNDPSSGASGSGTVDTFSMTHLGTESKRDASGSMRQADKTQMKMDMRGTITADGFTVGMRIVTQETTWSDVDTGIDFWEQGFSDITYTFGGESETEREEWDQAAASPSGVGGGDYSAISNVVPEPILLWPPMVGDSVVMTVDSVRFDFQVKRGTPVTIEGLTSVSIVIDGHILSGATGTSRIVIALEGPHAGLVTSYSQSIKRADEEFRMSMTLLRVR